MYSVDEKDSEKMELCRCRLKQKEARSSIKTEDKGNKV